MKSFFKTWFFFTFLFMSSCFHELNYNKDDVGVKFQFSKIKLNASLVENKMLLIEIENFQKDKICLPLFVPIQGDDGYMINRMNEGRFICLLSFKNNLDKECKVFVMCSNEFNSLSINPFDKIKIKIPLEDFKLTYGHGDIEFNYSAKMYLLENINISGQFLIISGNDEKIRISSKEKIIYP